MASKICSSCLRTAQRSSRPITYTRQTSKAARAFTISARRNVELPEPNATVATSLGPVTPVTDEGKVKPEIPKPKTASKLGKITETYSAYGATQILYQACAGHAAYKIPKAEGIEEELPKTAEGEDLGVGEGSWHKELGLPATFSTWSQVTMLHMYLLAARFRCFETSSAQTWQQHLLDHFFYDAENRMAVDHGMHARSTRNKYLKDMFVQWRGLLAAYDEGLVKGDAVLAAAVWRNVFKASEEVDIRYLARIVAYMRASLQNLDSMPDEVIQQASFAFANLSTQTPVVALKSKMMELPFDKAEGKPLTTKQP